MEDFKPYDEESLRKVIIERNWNVVQEELKQLLQSKKQSQELHPELFLPMYHAWIEDLIRENKHGEAFKIFVDRVANLYKADGEFVVQKDVKAQVNHLHLVTTER